MVTPARVQGGERGAGVSIPARDGRRVTIADGEVGDAIAIGIAHPGQGPAKARLRSWVIHPEQQELALARQRPAQQTHKAPWERPCPAPRLRLGSR
jgi:hypothetical protein